MPRRLLPLLIFLLVACDGTTDPAGPGGEEEIPTLTVDAVAAWGFVRLDGAGSLVTVVDPTTSSAWDLGVLGTSVMLNGGDAGPAGVEGYCVCQNASASDAQITAMTEEGGLADFEAVGAADVPADAQAWMGDGLAPAIRGWYAYDPVAHVVFPAPGLTWKLRTADGDGYAKLRIVAIEDATQQHAGRVTLEFAVQAAAGAPFGEVRRLTVDASAGRVAVDLQSAAVTPEGWDVALEGWSLRVNGGVSGSGQAGAVVVEEPFAQVLDAGDMTARHYAADAYGGVFSSTEPGARWYRYNLQGAHQIWPTYNVYLVRRGDEVYKVQFTGYYDETGDERHVTLRFARIGG